MNPRRISLAVLTVAAVLAVSPWAQLKMPQDAGPATLDVSAYPEHIREGYTLSEKKCGRCHTFARVLNTTAEPGFWSRYLGMLASRRNTQLTDSEAVHISDFLMYDQKNRKDKNPKGLFPPLNEDQLRALRDQSAP